MRGKLHYTPTHAVQQEPMKSAPKAKSFRLVSDGFVPSSRTITRTISAHQALSPFGQLGLLVEVSTSRPRSLSKFRRGCRGPREGLEPKAVCAVRAEHDSVSHLLESRYARAAIEVFEALRERVSRSIEDADVIEREDLASFAAPLDSYYGVASHNRACCSGWEGLAARVREYCRLRAEPFFANQRNHGCDGQNTDRNTVSTQFKRAPHSDCIPDVPLQVFELMQVISDCPQTVRVLEGAARAN